MNNKIGVFDSGIGGLTTLEEIRKLLPNEDYIFYADSKNNPYGNKSDKELCKITDNIVKILISKNVKMIVVACNTATTKCISFLRKKYKNMIFIGTEPAIKVACDNNYKNTLVLATPGTISSKRTHELIENNKKDGENIILVSCEGLASAIELNDQNKINEILYNYLDKYKNKKIDSIILGCTHYPYVKDKIKKIIPKATIIDGNIGVAKRVKYMLEKENLLSNKTEKGSVEIIKSR